MTSKHLIATPWNCQHHISCLSSYYAGFVLISELACDVYRSKPTLERLV